MKKGDLGGFESKGLSMLRYQPHLKQTARVLRKNMTDSEDALWARLRRKQLLGIQFYRQKPIGDYIVDFFAPKAKLVVEVDGSQHLDKDQAILDKQRDKYLNRVGLLVLRFSSRDVLKNIDSVIEVIGKAVEDRIQRNPP